MLFTLAALVHAAEFPQPFNTGENPATPPMSAADAAASLKLPLGFKATVFAAEPDVQNPIAMAWDARGRLWIAENYTYAERATKFESRLRDRVLIFEDRNGDGKFSARRVFTGDVQRLTSVEVGHGGVWLMCPPHVLFVPDRDEDGVADGPAEVVLDGFTIPNENYHNFANGLRFGPDGWLYGRCGGSSPCEPGVPGTPKEERVLLRGTMWRYHPRLKIIEALSAGTTNPWGHDWDAHGELFFINTVNGHLWHSFAGAHYVRGATLDPNPHAYELIDQHADHWHFDKAFAWQQSRDGAANAFGGGHAHAGVMIYLGDNWPADHRGKLFTLNFHGRRANTEILERRGSGYVGRHAPDFFLAEDTWFRGIDLGYGPDGGVFVLDWSDMGECHNALGVSRTSGRVLKIVYEGPRGTGVSSVGPSDAASSQTGGTLVSRPAAPVDLVATSGLALARLQTQGNEWLARQARLQLATRSAGGHKLTHAIEVLREMFEQDADPIVKLRALWTLHAIGGADAEFLRAQLRHQDEHVRTWAIRLLSDLWSLDRLDSQRLRRDAPAPDARVLRDFVERAETDSSALVRLALASTLQRIEPRQRPALARALVQRAEDAADHNLPLLIWYGLIPIAKEVPGALVEIAAACELPTTRRLIARRLAEDLEQQPAPLNALLIAASAKPAALQSDIIAGIGEGLRGWRRAAKPAAWDKFAAAVSAAAAPAKLLESIRELNLVFGDGRALDDVKAIALDNTATLPARQAALRALIEARAPDLRKICETLLRVRFLNSVAARGLALFDDPAIGERLVAAYSTFHPTERGAVLETLVSRPAFAAALLKQVEAGRIARGDLTAFHARQIRSFNDPELTQQLAKVWGELRDASGDKAALAAQLKTQLTPAVLAAANKSNGRAVYANLCGACHRLYGHGGDIGPDLTGAQRDNLDYLLENIVDPGAVVTADYRNAVVKLKDGRTLNGFIAARTTRTFTIRGMTESHTIERADVAGIEESPQSMMPDGLLGTLGEADRRDLIAYLMHPSQVPLPGREKP